MSYLFGYYWHFNYMSHCSLYITHIPVFNLAFLSLSFLNIDCPIFWLCPYPHSPSSSIRNSYITKTIPILHNIVNTKHLFYKYSAYKTLILFVVIDFILLFTLSNDWYSHLLFLLMIIIMSALLHVVNTLILRFIYRLSDLLCTSLCRQCCKRQDVSILAQLLFCGAKKIPVL